MKSNLNFKDEIQEVTSNRCIPVSTNAASAYRYNVILMLFRLGHLKA